jgi:hypothetical protein
VRSLSFFGWCGTPRKDKRGVDLISAVLPFGKLWYGEPNAVSNANWLRQISQPFTRCRDSRLSG